MDIQHFILEHGTWTYFVTFAWTFFEGETFVLIAGFAAAQGLLSAPLLVVAAWLGSFAGDQSYFWVGRHFGQRLMERRPSWRRGVDGALSWLKRYDAGFILCFRFIYGVRNFSSFALGVSGIDWRRFLTLNFIAAGIWAAVFVAAGYLFGHAFERALGNIAQRFSLAFLGLFVIVLVGAHFIHRLRSRRRRQSEADAPPSQ